MSLFDDPALKAAYNGLSEEDKKMYKRFGEEMFSFDFEVDKDPLSDYVAYISEGLKSGLHPSFLEESEVKALVSVFGDKWYERFGYDEESVKDPLKVTAKRMKKEKIPIPRWAKAKK